MPEGRQALFLETGSGIEPLIGVYGRQSEEPLRQAIENHDYKIRKVLTDVETVSLQELGLTELDKCFKNINSKEDYKRLYD